eukprot:gene8076-12537_t
MNYFFGSSKKSSEGGPNIKQLLYEDLQNLETPDENYYQTLKSELLNDHEDWNLSHESEAVSIWLLNTKYTSSKVMRLKTNFKEEPELLFKLLSEDIYFTQKFADKLFLQWDLIKDLDQDNILCYYSMKMPHGFLDSRDFVLMRSKYKTDSEGFIVLRSVHHDDYPEKSNFVRAILHITAYYVCPDGNGGCDVWYMTQNDFKGIIPSWILNWTLTGFAEETVKRINEVVVEYKEKINWKNEK